MAALQNIRHERFARYYLKTGVAAQAYRAAGYTANTRACLDAAASRLLRHVRVKARIGELRRQMSYKTKISLESLLQDLSDDRTLARSLGMPSAAIQATITAAKLVGLMVERKESGAPGDFAGMQTAEEIVAKVRAELGDAQAALLTTAMGMTEPEQEAEPSAPVIAIDDMPPPASGTLN